MRTSENNAFDLESVKKGPIPTHIAIIMDGNGRWATARGLARLAGHKAGVEVLDEILEAVKALGVKYFTVYAFSTENWKRPTNEVDGLMKLLVEFLDRKREKLMTAGVRLKAIGQIQGLPQVVQDKLQTTERLTAANEAVHFNIALNYGGRQELTQAMQALGRQIEAGDLRAENIDEQMISDHLYTVGQPDPDLLIRSSGEFRLSNFMLWQIAYAEIWMTSVLWPDFRKEHLLQAVVDYQRRDRRFGGINEKQVK